MKSLPLSLLLRNVVMKDDKAFIFQPLSIMFYFCLSTSDLVFTAGEPMRIGKLLPYFPLQDQPTAPGKKRYHDEQQNGHFPIIQNALRNKETG